MGAGVINQISQTRGMRVVAVADKMRDRAVESAGKSALVTDDHDEATGG